MKRVVLHIERLRLNGVRSADANAVASQLQGTLAELLGGADAARSIATRRDEAAISAGKITLEHGTKPSALGRAVGRAVFKRLSE